MLPLIVLMRRHQIFACETFPHPRNNNGSSNVPNGFFFLLLSFSAAPFTSFSFLRAFHRDFFSQDALLPRSLVFLICLFFEGFQSVVEFYETLPAVV